MFLFLYFLLRKIFHRKLNLIGACLKKKFLTKKNQLITKPIFFVYQKGIFMRLPVQVLILIFGNPRVHELNYLDFVIKLQDGKLP